MGEKSIEDWIEEDLRVDKEEKINDFRDRIEKFIRNKDGSLEPIDKDLGTPSQILAILIAAAVENLAGMRETDVVDNSEFYEFIDEKKNAVRANLSDLNGEGLIEKCGRGKYVLDYESLEEVLDRIGESNGN